MELVIELPSVGSSIRKPTKEDWRRWWHDMVELFKTFGAIHLAFDIAMLILTTAIVIMGSL